MPRGAAFRVRNLLAVLCLGFLCTIPASGSVTQVDGSIVPVLNTGLACCSGTDGNSLEICINTFESGDDPTMCPPNPSKIIDAIKDAATTPETFFPCASTTTVPCPAGSTTSVTFRDIDESAGFENS